MSSDYSKSVQRKSTGATTPISKKASDSQAQAQEVLVPIFEDDDSTPRASDLVHPVSPSL